MLVTSPPPIDALPSSTLRTTIGRFRFAVTIAVVLLALAAVNVTEKYGPPHTGLVLGPAVALVLVVLARRSGLTWDCLGMSRRALGKGFGYAFAAVAIVAGVYLIGAVLPLTRSAFHDVRYHLRPGAALLAALVVVPLGTVLFEEVAFRGVLLGLVNRHRGAAWASVSSSDALRALARPAVPAAQPGQRRRQLDLRRRRERPGPRGARRRRLHRAGRRPAVRAAPTQRQPARGRRPALGDERPGRGPGHRPLDEPSQVTRSRPRR